MLAIQFVFYSGPVRPSKQHEKCPEGEVPPPRAGLPAMNQERSSDAQDAKQNDDGCLEAA